MSDMTADGCRDLVHWLLSRVILGDGFGRPWSDYRYGHCNAGTSRSFGIGLGKCIKAQVPDPMPVMMMTVHPSTNPN